MTRRTARISYFVEYDDDLESPCVRNYNDGVVRHPGIIIGDVFFTVHNRPLCSISAQEMFQIRKNMEDRGGSFIAALAETLSRADSANMERLEFEFWNEINKYRTEYTELPCQLS